MTSDLGDNVRVRLPAEAALGEQGAAGAFVGAPDQAHVRAASAALTELAERVSTGAPPGGDERRRHFVTLAHLQHKGFLALDLFGFPLLGFDDNGEPTYDASEETPLTYGVTVNHPVPVQVEHTLAFLARYVARQQHITELQQQQQADVGTIDLTVRELDVRADRDLADVLRRGWGAAADELRARAEQAGLALQVTYTPAAITKREQLAVRLPWLRRAYNEVPVARDAIDRSVSVIGPERLYVEGGSEEARLFTERTLRTSEIGRYVTQAARDAFVCGNGYLLIGSDLSKVRALSPERVELSGDDGFALAVDGRIQRVDEHVLHLTGIDQPSSRYGISVLEPLLHYLAQVDVFRHASEAARRILAESLDPGQRKWAERTLAQAERVGAARDEAVRRLISPAPLQLPDPQPGLYFPGQEMLPTVGA